MKLIPAVRPTIILGTELISVSRPPTLVSRPSINKNPRSNPGETYRAFGELCRLGMKTCAMLGEGPSGGARDRAAVGPGATAGRFTSEAGKPLTCQLFFGEGGR